VGADFPTLNDILVRHRIVATVAPSKDIGQTEPTSGPELQISLAQKITHCVASTLSLAEDSVDPNVALSELGMDSVMTVELRTRLQQAMKIKVGTNPCLDLPNSQPSDRSLCQRKDQMKKAARIVSEIRWSSAQIGMSWRSESLHSRLAHLFSCNIVYERGRGGRSYDI